MSRRLAVVMDPIAGISVAKDTTLAMLLAARRRGWSLWYTEQPDLCLRDGAALGLMAPLEVQDDPTHWFSLGAASMQPLGALDFILMRKDPPFDTEYVHATQVLELAETQGATVANRPAALRDVSEKLALGLFPEFAPPTLVSARHERLLAFLAEFGDIVVKPLDGMGGRSVFRIQAGDGNRNVILETLTGGERRMVMAQRYLPEIADGDRRVLVVDGEPIPFTLARIPQRGDLRGNLAAGGRGEVLPITPAERRIAEALGPELRRRGLWFVGLDVIGGWLTEVNVTSPTCAREIEAATGLDIAGRFLSAIEAHRAMQRVHPRAQAQ
ncbi:MAG TPA: glutathione synthase [Gammaproteobacteria bacterium]|nr:glutathione synthase [Gammaproteobacteria bacterium]